MIPDDVADAVDYDAAMALPEGKTCGNCKHARRCYGFGFASPGQRSCDFYPNRFVEVAPSREAATPNSQVGTMPEAEATGGEVQKDTP